MQKASNRDFRLTCLPYEFSTGSLGWQGHTKKDVKVGGKTLHVQINLNCPILNSKGDGEDDGEDGEGTKKGGKIGTIKAAVKQILKAIGKAKRAEQDDLKEIKGIGIYEFVRPHSQCRRRRRYFNVALTESSLCAFCLFLRVSRCVCLSTMVTNAVYVRPSVWSPIAAGHVCLFIALLSARLVGREKV